MEPYQPYVVKSFKHDGRLHRMWMKNWKVPRERMHAHHLSQSMIVTINFQTPVRESDGSEWISKVPGISFFIPKKWYNIVALIEPSGVRYYCNVASPPYEQPDKVITYIDYDLDVIRQPGGKVDVVDRDEYERHKRRYQYNRKVQRKIRGGLKSVLRRIHRNQAPFQDDIVLRYFDDWQESRER